ncbi:hypothetical protein [Microbacterium sp.]|uniref:hypothetical protein n=1 Tax=Microbacterium sp. TaxID=51671 RepID=UPI003A93C2F6
MGADIARARTRRSVTAAAAAGLLLTAGLLAGCSSSTAATGSTLTVTPTGDTAQTVTIADVNCVSSSGKFTASATERVGDLSQFTATTTASTDRSVTWVHLDQKQWFMTTDAFTHDDGTVAFDGAAGKIGTSTDGKYPATFETDATLSGTATCTTQQEH